MQNVLRNDYNNNYSYIIYTCSTALSATTTVKLEMFVSFLKTHACSSVNSVEDYVRGSLSVELVDLSISGISEAASTSSYSAAVFLIQ